MASLHQHLARLEPRERRTLLIGACAALAIAIMAGLLPLERRVAAAQSRLATQRADLAFLQSLGPQLAQLAAAPRAAGGQSLVVLADELARAQGIASQFAGAQPAGEGSVSVRFQQVPFDALVAWTAALVQRSGAAIVSASVEAAGSAGVVSATLVLRAP